MTVPKNLLTLSWFVMPLTERTYAQQIAQDRAASKLSPEPLADILSGLEQSA
jgi:hypothetical protein